MKQYIKVIQSTAWLLWQFAKL